MPASKLKGKSLEGQKVVATLRLMQENEGIWNALLVFLGALFVLGTFPFYPIYVVVALAAVCGIAAYKSPPLGTLLSIVFVIPAVAFQSSVFGLLFLLVLAIVLFEMFERWNVISTLEVLIFAPFAFGQLPLFGWISILGMVLGASHFGSRKSAMISIPSVLAILFLSSVWMVQNSAFLPVSLLKYPSYSPMMLTKEPIELLGIPTAVATSLGGLFSSESVANLPQAMGHSLGNLLSVLFADSGLLQAIIWLIALYGISYMSGTMKGKRTQLISSLILFFVPLAYFIFGTIIPGMFSFELAGAVIATIAIVGALEQSGVQISHEVEETHKEKMKSFGKFGFEDMALGSSEKSLDDIGNYEDVKQELRDSIVVPLEKKEIAITYGLKPPSGILMFGPPGTGKTMLMRALAKELKYPFYYVKSSDILSQWMGESERNVAEIFTSARKNAPCIMFFDEIDALAKKRTSYGADDVTPRVLSIFLQEMDGAGKKKGKMVLVMGATNVPQQLDSAILRPGRFDKIIYMHLPEKEGREAILKVHTRKVPVDDDLDFEKLAVKTERFSGADLKNVVDEATGLAAKEAGKTGKIVLVSMEHFLSVLKRTKPSTGIAQLEDFERFKMDFERRSGGGKEDGKDEEGQGEIVKWEDVAGLGDVKQALLETLELPLLREDLMKEFKVKPSKGILLFGPPGCGKTLMAKAASGELKASFQVLSGAEIMKLGYTQAVTVIKEAFNRARENAPAIIFVDEIETFAPQRGIGTSEVVGQLLTEMDGLKELKGVVVLGATNRPSILDSAILRPGRFDKIFYISPPDNAGRAEMFKIHLGKFAEGLNLAALADASEGFTGADIAGIAQEAKMQAVRAKIGGRDAKITAESLLAIIKTRRPSVTKAMLGEYEQFKGEYGERR